MLKTVKMTVGDVKDAEKVYKGIKKGLEGLSSEGIEGTVGQENKDVEIKVHGPKDAVDKFIMMIDDLVAELIQKNEKDIYLFVEPFFKDEDFRGVFRFLKKK